MGDAELGTGVPPSSRCSFVCRVQSADGYPAALCTLPFGELPSACGMPGLGLGWPEILHLQQLPEHRAQGLGELFRVQCLRACWLLTDSMRVLCSLRRCHSSCWLCDSGLDHNLCKTETDGISLSRPTGPPDVEDADAYLKDHSNSRQPIQVKVCKPLTLTIFFYF